MWFVLSQALGAPQGTLPPQMQQGSVSTSLFGVVPKSYAWGMCHSPFVFVGTVVSFKPYQKKFFDANGRRKATLVYSSIKLQVERTLNGPVKETVVLDVPGGPWNGGWVNTVASAPQPVVGERYMVAYHHFSGAQQGDFSNWPAGQPVVDSTFTVDSGVNLPANGALSTELENTCDTITFD